MGSQGGHHFLKPSTSLKLFGNTEIGTFYSFSPHKYMKDRNLCITRAEMSILLLDFVSVSTNMWLLSELFRVKKPHFVFVIAENSIEAVCPRKQMTNPLVLVTLHQFLNQRQDCYRLLERSCIRL